MADSAPVVLITGANGFVGSRLCRFLHEKGMKVVAGVRRSADLSLLADCPVSYRYGDITDETALVEMVRDVDYVVHNAGVVKARKPETFFNVNAEGARLVCDAVATHNPEVRRLVYMSSQAAGGPSLADRPRIEEDDPAPVTAYGRSKLKGEAYVLEYANRIPVVALRSAGVYGPGDREIFSFFQSVYRHIRPMIGDVSRKLQLIHVDDLCRAVYLGMTEPSESGLVCYVAEERAYTMREMIAHLEAACGKKGVPLIIPTPLFKLVAGISGGVSRMLGMTPMLTREKASELLASWEVSVDRARETIGFQARIDFPLGAKQTYDWYIGKGWL